MRKYLILFFTILFSLILIISVLFPRHIEHGVLVEKTANKATFYINGEKRSFAAKNLDYDVNTVLNFKYNLLKAYSFSAVSSINERVMIKEENYYDLELTGKVSLNSETYFYEVNDEGNLTPSTYKKLLVGKNNVKSYKDSKGNLKTFILSPLDYKNMRVAISTNNFESIYHNSISFSPLKDSEIFSLKENFNLKVKEDAKVNITASKNSLILNYIASSTTTITKEFKDRIYIKGSSISVSSLERGYPSFTPSYGGVIEITPSPKGAVMINEVELEEYLTKVVPSEMPALSAVEALKCQAIAARTYAVSDMLANRFASKGFYVDDSTLSQVYNNSPTYPNTNKAVKETSGLIMIYNNEPIDAKYYSTSAGTGVNYSDIWFNKDRSSDDRPYLTTKNYTRDSATLPKNEEEWLTFYKTYDLVAVDSVSPYFRWNITLTKEEFTNMLNKSLNNLYERRKDFIEILDSNSKKLDAPPELSNFKDIKVLERSEGGNIIKLSIVFDNATINLLGDSVIRSSFRFDKEHTGSSISIKRYSSTPLNNASSLPSSFFSFEKKENQIILYGGGYGHGVGMSQYGAMELGKKGIDYKSILNMFYNDISFKKLY